MKPRTTLTLAILAGGFFSYIWFVERHTESTREDAESSARVIHFDENKVSALTIVNGESKLEFLKKDGVWKLEHPLSDRADGSQISTLLTSLESLRHNSKIEIPPAQEKEKLKEFGVAESDVRLKIKSDNSKETELLLGKDSAIEGKLYVRVQGSSTVFVVSNALRNQLTKKPDDFRDKKLSDTPVQQVQRLTVKTQEGELEIERKNNHWEIVKPLRARAADQKINDLLAGMMNAKVLQFFPEAPSPEQGLGEPRAIISLNLEGQKEAVTLKIGTAPTGDENKEKSFTRLSNRPAVTVLANSSLDPLLKARPNDLRDRKLVRVESDIVDRITLEPADQPKIVLSRKGEGWVQKDGDKEIKINESIPSKILTSLHSTNVTNFVADIASDLAPYGLEKPRMKLTLSSYSSENTAETKAGDRPIASILFGSAEGDSGYAKVEDEPFIVAAPRAFAESLPTNKIHLQPVTVWDIKPDAVTSLEILSENQTLKIERKDNVWKQIGGEGKVNEPNVTTLLKSLSNLTTNRWQTPAEAGSEASDKPTVTVHIGYKNADAPSYSTMQVGRALGDEGYLSTVSEKEGVFILPKSVRSALDLKLTE